MRIEKLSTSVICRVISDIRRRSGHDRMMECPTLRKHSVMIQAPKPRRTMHSHGAVALVGGLVKSIGAMVSRWCSAGRGRSISTPMMTACAMKNRSTTNDGEKRNPDPRHPSNKPVVHFMLYGETPHPVPGGRIPKDWPESHFWSGDWHEVNCPKCLQKRERIRKYQMLQDVPADQGAH